MKGIPLPPVGSFKFNVITDGLQREKQEKVAFARLMVNMLLPISGLGKEQAQVLLSEYAEEVYQFKYNYRYQPARVTVKKEQDNRRREDDRLMARVAAMTAKD